MSDTTHQGWTNKETYIIHYYFSDWYEDYRRDGTFNDMESFMKAWMQGMKVWSDDSDRVAATAMIEAFMDHVNWAELDAMYSKEEE